MEQLQIQEYFIPLDNENYNEYINRILNSRENIKIDGVYMEHHHIVPRCLNGEDTPDNLIWLFAQEHYYAHKLLAIENQDNNSLIRAWFLMSHRGKDKNIELTALEYEEARTLFAKVMSEENSGENSWNFGRKHTDEARKKMSEKRKGKPSNRKGCHVKHTDALIAAWNARKGTTVPIETVEKMRKKLNTPVKCIETGKIYESMLQAADDVKTSSSHIGENIRGKRKSAGGYHWELVEKKEIEDSNE